MMIVTCSTPPNLCLDILSTEILRESQVRQWVRSIENVMLIQYTDDSSGLYLFSYFFIVSLMSVRYCLISTCHYLLGCTRLVSVSSEFSSSHQAYSLQKKVVHAWDLITVFRHLDSF